MTTSSLISFLIFIVNFSIFPSVVIEESNFLCGDLLKIYAEKSNHLDFIGCETISNSQTIARATYKVSGKKSKKIEHYLVTKYEMGQLKWVCYGWENEGKSGQFEHEKLKEIDPYCSVIINMSAVGTTDDNQILDRDDVAFFTVTVEIVIA